MKRILKGALVRLTARVFQHRVLARLPQDELSVVALTSRGLLRFLPDPALLQDTAVLAPDPIRYATMALAIHRIRTQQIAGSFAEVGVWRGDTSKRIHDFAPERTLYLFDTFAGFPGASDAQDHRFRDTSVERVAQTIGTLNNIIIREGCFPESAEGLEREQFAFVMLDLDKYAATLAGLTFFYPRMTPGGYIFVHDYNSPESGWAVSQAVDHFLTDKPERMVELPDKFGSAIIRKV